MSKFNFRSATGHDYIAGDAQGAMRTEDAFNVIAEAFPDWSECRVAEGYRGWLDTNGIDAESDSGWLSLEAAEQETLNKFINEMKEE